MTFNHENGVGNNV